MPVNGFSGYFCFQVLEISEKLLSELRAGIYTNPCSVGKIFVDLADEIKPVYLSYCSSHDAVNVTLQKVRSQDAVCLMTVILGGPISKNVEN